MSMRYPQCILVSCEVPWDDRDRLLEECFRSEVRAILASGFRHVYIFGTAGEGYAVTTDQFRDVAGVFREETDRDDVHPMVGVIAMSTGQVVERLGIAYDMGFRAFQISLPPWGALDDDECMAFFADVCGAFPDASFLHYNLMRAGRLLVGADYRRLADAIPNLVATKNTRSDIHQIADIATRAPELQHFYGEAGFAQGCVHGECSLLSSFGPLFPRRTVEFFEHGVHRRWDELFPMQREYLEVIRTFLRPTSGRAVIDGAYDKMIVRASGVDMPLRLLPPYRGFDESVYEACVAAVREDFPDWFD